KARGDSSTHDGTSVCRLTLGPLYSAAPLPPLRPGPKPCPWPGPTPHLAPEPMPPSAPGPSDGGLGTPSGKPVGASTSRLSFSKGSPRNVSITGKTGSCSVGLVVGAMSGVSG